MRKYKTNYTSILILVLFSFTSCSQNSNDIISIEEEISIPDNLYPPLDIEISTHSAWTKTHYPKRIKEFMETPLNFEDIVFIGNSITEQGGNWGDKVNKGNAKNRGIAGDTAEGILARLNEITFYKPEKLFLLIGINNLFHDPNSVDKVYENIIKIVTEINSKSPKTKIFVQSVLPTTTDNLITKIEELNKLLENASNANAYTYVNLHHRFVTLDKKMNLKYSTDGVHLNNAGYEIWSEIIKNILD